MVVCDLCGQKKECFQRDIEGKRYDICSDCWIPLAKKLKGKGKGEEGRNAVWSKNRKSLQPCPETISAAGGA
jgi:hypothetical protein